MHTPILSLCIPTDGNVRWVIPVIESIYSQNVDNELFEVIISDNGHTNNLSELLSSYKYPNLKYTRSDAQGFTNIIKSLQLANGIFRKMLNHRSILIPGMLQEIISLVNQYKESRPILFFSDNRLMSKEDIIKCNTADELLYNLHYWITWSAGIGIWNVDVHRLDEIIYDKTFPNIAVLLNIRENGDFIIWNKRYEEMLDDTGKGGYNVFEAFAVIFLNLLQEYEDCGKISSISYRWTKKKLFKFLVNLYNQEILHKSKHNFDLSEIQKSVSHHYSRAGYFLMILSALILYLKGGIRHIISPKSISNN